MDYANFSTYHPMVANSDYSPIQGNFSYSESQDKPYFAEDYTVSQDPSLANFLDCDTLFDRPATSTEESPPAGFVPKSLGSPLNPTLPAAGISKPSTSSSTNASPYRTSFQPPPFGHLDSFSSAFSFDQNVNTDTFDPTGCASTPRTHESSRTPSLCGDASQLANRNSPDYSPRVLKRESNSSEVGMPPEEKSCSTANSTPKQQRKRGRPRLNRTVSDSPASNSSHSSKHQRTARLPHNQVERKYREGLNSELERLRRSVPSLPQGNEDGGAMGVPKPSKAMVLAGAIDYIKKLEIERANLQEECRRLRAATPGNMWERDGMGPNGVGQFLVDQ